MDKVLDRRLLIKGLLGVAGAGALAVIVPRQAAALTGFSPDELAPGSSDFPELEQLTEGPEDTDPVLDEGVELASHRRRRRRRRRRRWRRYCRREYWNGYYRRRCRRRPFWIWIWI
jgi:hypothetical protein